MEFFQRNNKKNDFYYLGKKYNINYTNDKDLILDEENVYFNKEFNLDKWYRKRASVVFKIELDKIYEKFPYEIPYPSLVIRNMKTRYGVCNIKLKKVTLNLELIKKDIIYIDYVIVHELSHFIEMNHSDRFWHVVGLNYPNYKEIRRIMKKY